LNKLEIKRVLAGGKLNVGLLITPAAISLPLFGKEPMSIAYHPEPAGEDEGVTVQEVTDVVYSLARLPRSIIGTITKPLYAEYLNSIDVMRHEFDTPQEQLDWEAEELGIFENPRTPNNANDIWKLVCFREIRIMRVRRKLVAIVHGDCAWDGEHGIAVFFQDGRRYLQTGTLADRIE
jgi:Domain of unknown function (DUF6985)